MSDLNDRNAHRFLNVGEESALAKAIAAYAAILGNVRLSWGDDERDALEMVDALSNEWDNLFNAVGQRLRNHKPLENARNALVPVSERLEEIIRSPIGTRPRNDSKDIIRNFIITLSTLQEAMISELANYSPLSLGSPFSQEGFERAKRGDFLPMKVPSSSTDVKLDERRNGATKTYEYRKHRHRGHSISDGEKVHQDIESDSSKHFIKVNNREFKLTRTVEWVIVDRMLKKIKDLDYGFTIDLSTKEYNSMSSEGKAFVLYCLDRERVTKRSRASKYTGKARIKPGLLKPNKVS